LQQITAAKQVCNFKQIDKPASFLLIPKPGTIRNDSHFLPALKTGKMAAHNGEKRNQAGV